MTWMNWRYMYPHDLGNLHMIHIHKVGGGRISVDAKNPQRQQQQPAAAMEKKHLLYRSMAAYIECIYIYIIYKYIQYMLIQLFMIFSDIHLPFRQSNVAMEHPQFSSMLFPIKPPLIFRPWPGRPRADPAFGMKSRKLYSTSFSGERNSGHGK